MNNSRFFTVNQLADATGLDRRTISKKLKTLKAQKGFGKGHYYDGHEAFPLLFGDRAKVSELEKESKEQILRLNRAKAAKAEFELEVAKGNWLKADDVEAVWSRQIFATKSRLRAVPSKSALHLANMTEPHEIFNRLLEDIDEALTELSTKEFYDRFDKENPPTLESEDQRNEIPNEENAE